MPHQNVRVPLSAAQILNLGTTPVQIVAPSAGQIIVPYNTYLRLFAGTTPFNPLSGDHLAFYLGNPANTQLIEYPGGLSAIGFADQTVDMSQWHDGWMGGGATADSTVDIIGSGLFLALGNGGTFPSGTNWTLGNGTMLALVEYSLVTP